MLFLYHNLSLLPKSGSPSHTGWVCIPGTWSCQQELWSWLFWPGYVGVVVPQGRDQPQSFRCADNTFFLLQPPSAALSCTLSCKCVFPFSGLDCPLILWLTEILACLLDRLENFAAPFCFCLHKWIFFCFPLRHVSGWHRLFFSPSQDTGVQLSCRTGKEVGSSFVLADLKARAPLPLTVLFLLLHYCLGWGVWTWVYRSLSKELELSFVLLWWWSNDILHLGQA